MDGLTFAVKADTNTGHFEVFDYNVDFEEDNTLTPNTQSNSLDQTDKHTKSKLAEKYSFYTPQD